MDFDAAWAKKTAGWIVDEIKTIDGRLPGADPATYKARLVTSQNFCSDAFDIEPDSASTAAAKYLAVRQNTPPILKAINAALGTHFVLPPAPE
ncbi:hypothetical protein [Allobranchiibius huperziae]|uniref:Uncharacterized protein n=1 Tax=Allobranchiibius huperziae TaxID=1874116 RepID=A0A853D8C3_9MICO|nr:hypothetical protein [Allobranchiibius huperziae]NYJ73422.1 hypothetical protein [Allobranchiibius huperziae]